MAEKKEVKTVKVKAIAENIYFDKKATTVTLWGVPFKKEKDALVAELDSETAEQYIAAKRVVAL